MILVVGGTGALGGRIAGRARQRGLAVRAMVRRSHDAERLRASGVEVVPGDLTDRASLDAACQGVEAVVTTANSAQRGGADDVAAVDLAGNAALIEAATAAGVRRFVFLSVLGATPDHPVPFVAAKAATEERLRSSGMDWTVLAPEPFMEVWLGMVVVGPALAGGDVVTIGSGDRRHSFVSIEDVAAFAVAALDHPAAARRHIPIGGPDAVSFRDVVGRLEQTLGRPITQRSLPAGSAIPGLPATVAGLLALLDTYDSVVDSGPAAGELGVTQTSGEAYRRAAVARGAGPGPGR